MRETKGEREREREREREGERERKQGRHNVSYNKILVSLNKVQKVLDI